MLKKSNFKNNDNIMTLILLLCNELILYVVYKVMFVQQMKSVDFAFRDC